MSYRSFTDSSGRSWLVWRVLPHAADRRHQARRLDIDGLDGERDGVEPRSGQDRRHDPTRAGLPDRRSGTERRTEPGRRSELDRRSGTDRREAPRARVTLPGDFSNGWLCFESSGDKRRLAPVPDAWERARDGELVEWLALAESPQSRRAGVQRTRS
jgi:hypothetical protein